MLIEPDFSNKGFGHPDAVVRLQRADGTTCVLLVEAKRASWADASVSANLRGMSGYNSKLNGQIELNHRLAMALADYREGGPELTEPEWVQHTPYHKDVRRVLKNPAVLHRVVTPLSGLDVRRYYHLCITSDSVNPLRRGDLSTLMPEMYHQDYSFKNAWPEFKAQFGWINWNRLSGVVMAIHESGRLPHASYFLSTLALNQANMHGGGLPEQVDSDANSTGPLAQHSGASTTWPAASHQVTVADETGDAFMLGGIVDGPLQGRQFKGMSLIYVPSYKRNTFIHFSWEGESCRLRDYSLKSEPSPYNPGRRSQVEQNIRYEVRVPRRGHPTNDVAYWFAEIQKLNQQYLRDAT